MTEPRVSSRYAKGSVVAGYLDNGTWSACFGLSYRDLLLFDAVKSKRIIRPGGREIRAVSSSGQLPDSRNDVVRGFLDTSDGEWLFFVDTDMAFQRTIVEDLLRSADMSNRPVVGALCFAAKRGPVINGYQDSYMVHPTIYTKRPVGFSPEGEYPRDAVVEVDGTGSAAILIHRTVLEKIRDKYGDNWYTRLSTEDESGWYGEDLSFCMRCTEVGVPLHVNTAVKTAHHKGLVYLDEDMYMDGQGLTWEGVETGELPRSVR